MRHIKPGRQNSYRICTLDYSTERWSSRSAQVPVMITASVVTEEEPIPVRRKRRITTIIASCRCMEVNKTQHSSASGGQAVGGGGGEGATHEGEQCKAEIGTVSSFGYSCNGGTGHPDTGGGARTGL